VISFTVKDDSRFWQAVVNTFVCVFILQTTPFDTQLSKAFFIIYALFIVYFSYLSVHYWRSQSTLLYLQLDHENNQLCFVEYDGVRLFSISNGSKANAFGIWLKLKSADKDQDTVVQKQCFFARWQMNQRAFRAIHRHLIWHID
jgi:hypothetical protein